jgi:hypothetical protein
MSEEIRGSAGGELSSPGPYLAKVVSHLDRTYSGYLQVEILQEAGNTEARQAQLHSVRYLSPFSGQTSADYLADSNDYNNTQKAYGFWMVPPDPGAIVVVIFIDSDPKKGYWIGCVHDMNMNFSVPGHAATTFHTDGKKARVPVAEYNKVASAPTADTTKIRKPASKLQDKLLAQGTLEDDIRGITTSSARREIPSMVFGISTPGPTDKTGRQAPVGKHEYKIPNAFVSRLGGSEFIMDDGDDKWEREKTPSEGPPVYKSVEDGQTGLRDRPHNELMRFRTRTGHQILMHNSEDLIYIGNSRGTAWIELTSDGKMDVYCEDSISFRTKQDFNFYADRDINMHAGRNFNIKVEGEMHTHVKKDSILIVDENQNIHIKKDVQKTYDKTYKHLVKENVDKVYQKDFTHTVLNSVSENFASSGGTVKTTTGGSIDVVHNGTTKMTYNGAYDHTVTGDRKVTTGGTHHINSGGQHIETASQIHMNGPTAAQAASAAEAPEAAEAVLPEPLKTHKLPDLPKPDGEIADFKTPLIVRRAPTPEPYPHHENIDPLKYKPAETDRDKEERYDPPEAESPTETMKKEGEYWKKYSTTTDTFAKVGK